MVRLIKATDRDLLYTLKKDPQWDISAAEITFTVKEDKLDTAPVIFERKNLAASGSADEIEMGPANDQFTLHVINTNTSGLTTVFDKDYWTELKVVDGIKIWKYIEKWRFEQSLTV